MSAVKGVYNTLADLPIGSSISNLVQDAKLCMAYDEYEASALANASTIEVCAPLPVGARIVDIVVYCDDMGSTVTVDVGDADDADRYLDGVSLTTANSCMALAGYTNALGEINGFGYQILGTGTVAGGDDTQLIITTAGIFSGTIKFMVIYAI